MLTIKPGPMLWYLFALIFWRLIYAGMYRKGVKVKWQLIVVIALISILAGFIPWIGREFALSRFIYFAPYFFLGIMAQDINIIEIIRSRVPINTAVIVLFATIIVSCLFVIYPIVGFRGVFAGADPYPIDNQEIYMLARLISYSVAFIVSVSFIRLFSVDKKLIGEVGKDSLKFYMFHGLCLMAIESFNVPRSTLWAIAYTIIVSLVIYCFNKTKGFSFYYCC